MKAWKLLTRLHSTSQSKKQLHLDIWASRSRDPADGPHQSFWGHPKKSPTREMTPNSGPRGASVNDGIEKELCSLKYVLFDEAMREVLVLGQGTQLAKFYIESEVHIG